MKEVDGLSCNGRWYTLYEMQRVKKLVDGNEAVKFLKLMKHDKYSMVDQLKKTSTKILLLSLILSLKPHRKTL